MSHPSKPSLAHRTGRRSGPGSSRLARTLGLVLGFSALLAQAQVLNPVAPSKPGSDFRSLIVGVAGPATVVPATAPATATTTAPAGGGFSISSGLRLAADGAEQWGSNADQLSKVFPAEHQDRMRKAYLQSKDVFVQIEQRMGWPRNDVAGAMAAFIVGNYMVMRGVEVGDAHTQALAEQLAAKPEMSARLGSQTPQALRSLYEQCAMVGTFMALAQLSQKTNPQPATQQKHLRDSARANLQLVLGRDPERLSLGPNGLGWQ